ncbi:pyridoxal phosphate-dependent aminotransferase [Phaeocystidibacter marisrubri]|uniref:Aminotransferase n=1 Tax=Phaeocystidibacter marisrubri TaxID=1577780 RepID=A0A6L3ZI19_9FLAO|nr:pyridoxal phosphate-dependent aminotransferase [Phaeocystidibacter marisrubri]KAB2817125.1 pyridoxal phosphate-dependent aminotransferase [Phaeocystidibacter marisrubri]GGH76755.1 aminotransferase [Phaeocystidibacter marisrubri]
MTEQLSTRVQALELPMTIEMSKKSRELAAKGVDVISLSLGEPDFDTPDFIKEAAIEGIHQNYSHYMPVPGFTDLREAIAAKFKRDNHLTYGVDQIIVSTGAKQTLANLMLSLIEPGDEVIIPAPYWVSYLDMVKFCEGVPVVVESSIETGYKITPEQLEASITDKSKLMIFSSPNNPSGAMYSESELEGLARVLRKYPNIFVISDEIYELIQYGYKHTSIASLDGMYDRTATVNGLSKGFAMTGWRIGYMGAPAWVAKACDKVQSQFTSGTNSIAQRAAIAAVSTEPSQIQYMIDAFTERRTKMLNWLGSLPGFRTSNPEGAFYVFAEISELIGKSFNGKVIENDMDLCIYFLEEGHVSSVPGSAFGLPGHIRFSYAASISELEEAYKRLAVAIDNLSA